MLKGKTIANHSLRRFIDKPTTGAHPKLSKTIMHKPLEPPIITIGHSYYIYLYFYY